VLVTQGPTLRRRQAKLARSVGESPTQVMLSRQPGSECCVSRRRRRPRSVHSGCVGCVIEPRNGYVAGAETVQRVERNMDRAAKRGHARPAGVEEQITRKRIASELGRSRVRPGQSRFWSASGRENRKPMMNERGKSDPAVVAAKLANKAERSAAEPVEPRAGTKGNANQQHTVGRRAGKPCHRCWRAYVKPQNSDLPSLTRGRSRMRESRTYGSVRGAGSNLRPYRDRQQHPPGKAAIWG